MEIRNIYKDSYGERLYSVLLDEGELSLFSAAGQAVLARRAANKLAKRNWQINLGREQVQKKLGELQGQPQTADTRRLISKGKGILRSDEQSLMSGREMSRYLPKSGSLDARIHHNARKAEIGSSYRRFGPDGKLFDPTSRRFR